MNKEDVRVCLVLAAACSFNLWFIRRCTRSRSRSCDNVRSWANLPHDLLLKLTDELELIDLLSFRGVCKDWRSAASRTATTTVEPYPKRPWLMIRELNNPLCELHDPWTYNHYKITLPELVGTTCLATKHGWLLLFQEGKIFFFAPFSRTKIPLPDFPYAKIKDQSAIFSESPTSRTYTICVAHRTDPYRIELGVLNSGDAAWNKYTCEAPIERFGPVIFANRDSRDGFFYFLDSKNNALCYESEKEGRRFTTYPNAEQRRRVMGAILPPDLKELTHFMKIGVENWVKLEDDTSFSSCGASFPAPEYDFLIRAKKVEASRKPERCHFEGIWIQPIFQQIE